MQYGSVTREDRKNGPAVWSYRWWEPGPNRKRIHRRLIIGSLTKFKRESAVLKAIAGLRMEINSTNAIPNFMTVAQLADHFRQRELTPSNIWKSYATGYAYEGHLRKWIVPRWGEYPLESVRTIEVESWLRQLPLAPATCAKLRSVMKTLFNHARRYDLFDRNPIELVRQSAKRRKIPAILTVEDIQQLLGGLQPRERTLVLLAVCTGLRRSELFALQWQDIDFGLQQITVTRSIVYQVVGICKTEASKRPVPLNRFLADALQDWRCATRYGAQEDWVFASPHLCGKKPYYGQALMEYYIRPAALKLGIDKRIGWHTFRHTYSTLLHELGTNLKVSQELLRHSSIRVTMDHYTQAVSPTKRAAQSAVVALLFPETARSSGHTAVSEIRQSW
jgi:integrase